LGALRGGQARVREEPVGSLFVPGVAQLGRGEAFDHEHRRFRATGVQHCEGFVAEVARLVGLQIRHTRRLTTGEVILTGSKARYQLARIGRSSGRF
jgi:hypothetical protein